MLNRRGFFAHSSVLAFAPIVPQLLLRAGHAAEARANGRILVVIEMEGGNDGVNTIVPCTDEGYNQHRSRLRLPKEKLIRVTDSVALHPAMRGCAKLLEQGQLAILQGVGYPNSSESHEVARAVWHTSRLESEDTAAGWLGQLLDRTSPNSAFPSAMLIGDNQPSPALRGRRTVTGSMNSLEELLVSQTAAAALERSTGASSGDSDDLVSFVRRNSATASTAAAELNAAAKRQSTNSTYPSTELARRMKLVSRLIQADLGTSVFYVVQPGYDTHSAQLPMHARLLEEFSDALRAFLNDLKTAGIDKQVVVFGFSEFGRRVSENASEGTDHGTSGPVFLAGSPIQGDLLGETPSMTDLDDGNLKTSLDFRRVYASLLDDWLKVDSNLILGSRFETLPLIRKA